jgi:hypothetical protein
MSGRRLADKGIAFEVLFFHVVFPVLKYNFILVIIELRPVVFRCRMIS